MNNILYGPPFSEEEIQFALVLEEQKKRKQEEFIPEYLYIEQDEYEKYDE